MDRFSGLLRQKNKALKVFANVRDNLGSVVADLNDMIETSKGQITSFKSSITEEEQAILFATREIESANNTIRKINELMR